MNNTCSGHGICVGSGNHTDITLINKFIKFKENTVGGEEYKIGECACNKGGGINTGWDGAKCSLCSGSSKTDRWLSTDPLCQSCGGGFQRGLVTSTHLNDIIKQMSKNGYGGGLDQEACVKCAPSYFGNKEECIMCPTRLPNGAPFEQQCSGHGDCKYSGENPPEYLDLTLIELKAIKNNPGDVNDPTDNPVCTCRQGSGFKGIDCGECDVGYYYAGGVACVECEEYPQRCLGGRNELHQCIDGYDGIKCLECSRKPDYNSTSPKNGYYKMGSACEPCPENDVFLILIVCALLIVVIILLLFIYKLAQSKLPLAPMASAIRHMQFMAFFIEIPGLPYPPFLLKIYRYLSTMFSFNIADMTSPECIIETKYEEEWIVYTSGPLAMVSLIILWAVFGDPVIVWCKIWAKKRRGAFEKSAFGRSRSQVRKSQLVHPNGKKSKNDSDTDSDNDSDDSNDAASRDEDDIASNVKKDFERDQERVELEDGIARSRQKEHTKKRLEERRQLRKEQELEEWDNTFAHEEEALVEKEDEPNEPIEPKKKLSRLEKRRLKKQRQRSEREGKDIGNGGSKKKKKLLSRQLSQSGRNIARISHEFHEDLNAKQDALETEKKRQRRNSIAKLEEFKERKVSFKNAATKVKLATSLGRRTRKTRNGGRRRMSVAEKARAKVQEREQMQRELSTNWNRLRGAAGTVVNKRKEAIKERIQKREERMRLENVDRVLQKSVNRETKKLRAKSLNRTMFMATVLLMLIYMTIVQKSAEVWICSPNNDGTSTVRGTNMVCNYVEPYMVPIRCGGSGKPEDPFECDSNGGLNGGNTLGSGGAGGAGTESAECKLQTYDEPDAPRYSKTCCPDVEEVMCEGITHHNGSHVKQCNPRTVRGVGLVNWTTPYTLPSGWNQSRVWNHILGVNLCEGDDYDKVKECEPTVDGEEKEDTSIFSNFIEPCAKRQKNRQMLVLLFQWIEYVDEADTGLMFERVKYKLQGIGAYPPPGVNKQSCDGSMYHGCHEGKKVTNGPSLTYVLLLSMSIPFFILYGIGTPLIYMVILGKASAKRQLHEETLRTRYGWVYTKFNERCWWFFAVDMIRKLLTVCVAVLANGTVLTTDLVGSIGHLKERPCTNVEQYTTCQCDAEGNGCYIPLNNEGKCPLLDGLWCPSTIKNQNDGTAMIQAGTNILFILINMVLLLCVRPYRCLECKLEQLRLTTNKKEGNDVKLAMLSFEDVIEAKIKNQSEKAEDSNNSTGSRGRRSALQGGKSTDSAKRWKSAGTRIKMTNMLSGKVKKAKSKKWWEQDEYLSWHVLKRKQCYRGMASCMKCQCFNGCWKLCCSKKEELEGKIKKRKRAVHCVVEAL